MKNEKESIRKRKQNDRKKYKNTTTKFKFPDSDNPIFDKLYHLINNDFDKTNTKQKLLKHISKKDKQLQNEKEKIEILHTICTNLDIKIKQNGYKNESWENLKTNKPFIKELSEKEHFCLKNNITIDKIDKDLKHYENLNSYIRNWKNFIKNIKEDKMPKEFDDIIYKNIEEEINYLFNLFLNIRHPYDYFAQITELGGRKDDFLGKIADELEKQLALCRDPFTGEAYITNGMGGYRPIEDKKSKINLFKIIVDNTILIKGNSENGILNTSWLNIQHIYKKIPEHCKTIARIQKDIVGFNNCFYSVKRDKLYPLDYKVPLFPHKKCNTELYLDEELPDNAMKEILNECFTEKDAELILCYLGCCLYDEGYTKRQESLFIMGTGNLGKTTFVKSLCSIFDRQGTQSADKISKRNQFGLSVFSQNDVIIIDEITTCNSDFIEKIKEISSGNNISIEKKGIDTLNYDAELIPRMFLIGNNIPESIYKKTSGAGATRRIAIVNPKKDIKSLNKKPTELTTDTCKQWLVQQATKAYIKHNLHKNSMEIGIYTDEEKEERLYYNTYPEKYMLQKHFKLLIQSNGEVEYSERMEEDVVFDIVHELIKEAKLEPTISPLTKRNWFTTVKEALDAPQDYKRRMYDGIKCLVGVTTKTKEAEEKYNKIKNKKTEA